jgi:hypothetical protein
MPAATRNAGPSTALLQDSLEDFVNHYGRHQQHIGVLNRLGKISGIGSIRKIFQPRR